MILRRLPLLTALALATPAAATPPPAPRLVVAIAVDQFSADLFAEYRPLFRAGLARLQQGVVFPSGYQSHAATETCPGHATILTGARPARSGVIANNWFDLSLARPDKAVYCSEDPTLPGSSSTAYTVSTGLLKVPTLGDRMKRANPASRVVSVAGKDRAAVMMGGHDTDQLWFWSGKGFVTLAARTAPPPVAVARTNAAVAALVARPAAAALPAACRSRSVALAAGTRSVGVLADRKAEDFRGFRTAVEFDRITTDLAIELVEELKLGRGPAPDLLALGLSATDYVGHGFGTEGAEMCAQMLSLDDDIDRLLTALDRSGVPYSVVLTADHGGHDLPERDAHRASPATRADPALSPTTLGDGIARELGLTIASPAVYGDGPFGDWYLNRAIPPAMRSRFLATLVARLTAHPQIAKVFTAEELARTPSPIPPIEEWSLAERARAAFDPERSGDLVVLLKQNVTPITAPGASVATHGSPYIYDRRVPILFWWPNADGFEQPLGVETVDIMPTLAALLKLPVPAEEIDGRCLDLDAGAGTSCPG